MKPYLILLVLLLAFVTVFGQQNAPVAGQASTLADLLKKDYSSIDPDLRGDEIVKDRALAISIFKQFLKASYKPAYTDTNGTMAKSINNAAGKYGAYSQIKRVNAQSSSMSVSTKDAANALNKLNQKNNDTIDKARLAYYQAQQNADSLQFNALIWYYGQDKNKFIATILDLFRKKYSALVYNQSCRALSKPD